MSGRARPLRKVFFLVSSFFLLMAGSIYWLNSSPYFSLKTIDIQLPDNPYVSKEDLLKLTGLPLGKNIFTLKLKDIKAHLEAHPWVAQAFVSRRLPHKLFIKIKLEQPIAMTVLSQNVYLINSHGRLFAPAKNEQLKYFPGLVGLSKEEKLARQLSSDFLPVIKLLVFLKKNNSLVPCYDNISQIKILREGFLLITRDAIEIKFPKRNFKELVSLYHRLDRIFSYLYDTKRYNYTKMIRLDYPKAKAAIIFKEG